MGDLSISNLDDAVIDRLKAQARANERSLEGEVRYLLTRHVSDHLRLAEFRAEAAAMSATLDGTKQTDSTVLIREDRDGIRRTPTGHPRRAGDGERARCPPLLP